MKIYLITTLEHLEINEYKCPDFGTTRSPGFFLTLEEAKDAVEHNSCDICETCFEYAIIEEIEDGLYTNDLTADETLWYRFSAEKRTYEQIPTPSGLGHYCGFGAIG